MARTESRVKVSIWQDKDFRNLPIRSQRMYLVLVASANVSLCGVLPLTPKKWAATAKDETVRGVDRSLRELEEARFVVVDRDNEEVWVRSFIKHDGVSKSPRTLHTARGQVTMISSPIIRPLVEAELAKYPPTWKDPDNKNQIGWAPTETPPDGLPDTPADTVPDGVGDTHFARSLQSPSPDSSLQSPPPAGNALLEFERSDEHVDEDHVPSTTDGTDKKLAAFANRLYFACEQNDKNAAARHMEAYDVVAWALTYVAPGVLDEAITWAEQLDKPPTWPQVICKTVKGKAADGGYHDVPDYRPKKRLLRSA